MNNTTVSIGPRLSVHNTTGRDACGCAGLVLAVWDYMHMEALMGTGSGAAFPVSLHLRTKRTKCYAKAFLGHPGATIYVPDDTVFPISNAGDIRLRGTVDEISYGLADFGDYIIACCAHEFCHCLGVDGNNGKGQAGRQGERLCEWFAREALTTFRQRPHLITAAVSRVKAEGKFL